MHDFERRMEQALAAIPNLAPGRRTRLTRPLRQIDARCWPDATDANIEPAMLAGMRIVTHELLETLCLQLEGLLSACNSDHERAFALAIYAIAQAERWQVSWRRNGIVSGCSFPARDLLVIELHEKVGEPNATFSLERFAFTEDSKPSPIHQIAVNIGGDSSNSAESLTFSRTEIEDDPFACARKALVLLSGT